jgi:hypothetical protein
MKLDYRCETYGGITKFNLYEMARSLEYEGLLSELNKFNLDQLKHIAKTYFLGGSNIKKHNRLAEYIADQAKKRTTDVFKDQI